MAQQADITTGRCLCGAVRYEYRGAPAWVLHCHCDSCRRHTSSAVATFVCVDRAGFRFTAGAPAVYASSPGVRRSFCGRCGSPLAYEAERTPDEVHLYAGTLTDIAPLAPEGHVHAEEQLPWLEILDTLPRWAHGRRGGEAPIRCGPRRP
jgi:hypothetical protein